MSDLLNSASLVMIPSGYKEDTVYSVVPSDGSGDLSFTRASNGSRVNSAGLVEVTPWNELTYSQEIQNTSAWNVIGGDLVVTGNAVISPDGTQNAGAITLANSANRYFVHTILGLTGGVPYTYSVYMKSASGNLSVNMGGVNGLAGVLKTVTTEWQRFTYTFTPSTSYGEYFGFDNRGAGSSTSGTLYLWGAQLNIGSTAKPYFPTTDRLNVPRLTYQNGGGGCPSLLLEKQSTNLYPYSEDLTQWATSGSPTVTGNDSISPDGTTNADRVQFSASGNLVYNSGTGSAGTNTLTVYAKAKSGTAQKFRFFANGATTVSSDFTATDQWQRFEYSYTFSAVTAGLQGASTGASDVLFWGFQHEVSSYATSYIPTTSSSATRVADACFKTGISSLIGQTEGVLFVDFNFIPHASQVVIAIEDWATNLKVINIGSPSNTEITAQVFDGGNSFVSNFGTAVIGQRYKCALAYKTNNFAFYVNGTQVSTGSTGSVPACVNFQLGRFDASQSSDNSYNQVALFPTRLTNAELASLTTI